MSVTLDQQAKKGLVKYLQSQINHHIDSNNPDRVTIAQVGEWLARGLGFDDQNELASQLKPFSVAQGAETPEDRQTLFAQYVAKGLVSEIEDSALDKPEGWAVLLLKYAHLCVSLYYVDNPVAEHVPAGHEGLAQLFFAGYLAGPFNAQSDNRFVSNHWPVWNPEERRELLMMLSDYSETILCHKNCPSLVTCVADHSQAIAIGYQSQRRKFVSDQVQSLFTSAPILRQVAEDIASLGEKMGLSVAPRRDLLMAMLVAMQVVHQDIEGFLKTGRSEQAELKKCRG